MKELIIHVGLGKTGTTAIQQSFVSNGKILHDAGVYCCDRCLLSINFPNHGFETEDEFWKLLWSDEHISEKIMNVFTCNSNILDKFDRVIWSNEGLVMRWGVLSPFVNQMSKFIKVKVVIYFRNQADWLVSAYLQWAIKDKQNYGGIRTWDEFASDKKNEMDYLNIIQSWIELTNNNIIFARSYDKIGNVVDDFYNFVGVNINPTLFSGRVYETPEYTALSLFKLFNHQYSKPHPPEPLMSLLQRSDVLNRNIQSVDPCPIDVSQQELDKIEAEYSRMNTELYEKYGVELNSHKKIEIKRRDMSSPINTDIIAAMLMINVHLQKRVDELQLEINKLKKANG